MCEFVVGKYLKLVDDILSENTFTSLCPADNTGTWVDHVVDTEKVGKLIMNSTSDDVLGIRDHFLLSFYLKIDF